MSQEHRGVCPEPVGWGQEMHGLEQPAFLENLCWTESWESGSQIWSQRWGGGIKEPAPQPRRGGGVVWHCGENARMDNPQ